MINIVNKGIAFFLLWFLTTGYLCNAQNSNRIDSLVIALNNSQVDSNKLKTLSMLTKELYYKGDFIKCKQFAIQQKELALKTNRVKDLAESYNMLGMVGAETGKLHEAIENYTKAKEIAMSINNQKNIANAYNNLGTTYNQLDNFAEALNCHVSALKIREAIGDKSGIAQSYGNIGVIYKNQKKYDDALASYSAALNIRKELDDKRGIAIIYQRLAAICSEKKQPDSAIENFQHALKIYTTLNDKSGIANSQQSLGFAYRDKGELFQKKAKPIEAQYFLNKAIDCFNLALTFKTKLESKQGLSNIYNGLGSVYILLDNYNKAEEYLQKSAELAKEGESKRFQKDAYFNLYKLDTTRAASSLTPPDQKLIYWQRALKNLEMAIQIKDSIFNEDNTKQIAEIKTKYETEKKDQEIRLLAKDNELQSVNIKQQYSALQLSLLEKEKNRNQIALLNKDKEFQSMQLNKTAQELKNRELENKANTAELELTKKDKMIKEKQLSEQTLYRNLIITGSILLLAFGLLLFNRFRLSKKIESQQALLNERKRISNELHDDLGAQLSTARMFLNSMKNNADSDKNKMLVENSIQLIDGSINDLRKIMDDLQVSTLQEKGYIKATEELVNKINSLQQINFTLSHSGLEKRLEQKTEHQLFRITQELINNSLKYAKAKNVSIDLVNRNGTIVLLYEDDGIGFDIKNIKRGYGLTNIETRVKNINGVSEFDSSPGKGARTIIEVPLTYA